MAAQVVTLAAEVVSASRLPQPPEHVAATVRQIEREALQAAPTATLDGALRAIPGFSLFRRSDSFTANPTAQGVSLRGLGPSGASRSLVLLDGVPLNDPFGGWVAWTKVPREGLARVEVVPGGGATAWGNAALGGVVQLLSARVQAEVPRAARPGEVTVSNSPIWERRNSGRVSATVGDFNSRSLEFVTNQPVGRGAVQVLGSAFATDGFSLVAPERRGPIDVAAWSRHRWLAVRWQTPLKESLEFSATARGFEEFRGNGTPYTHNGSREKFFSASLAGSANTSFPWLGTGSAGTPFTWHATVYAQDQSFASTFSGVNAARTAETPASDQFAVPATTFGAAWTGSWRHNAMEALAQRSHTSVGLDVRRVWGETRENFTFTAGNFTRLRIAGGEQAFAGLFALHEHPLAEELRATIGTRLDIWRDGDGHRRETDRNTTSVFRDDRYADHRDTEVSPNVGLVWTHGQAWRVRTNLGHAFRRPTLNELYRPFRQGANVTEANPALRTERVTNGELGIEWTPLGRSRRGFDPHGWPVRDQPAPLTFSATVFRNDLRDAVGNVTIARGPGTFPIVGTLAAGGLGRQRLNLDRTRTQGVELSAAWHFAYRFSITGDMLFNDATVRGAAVAPALVGKQVAQVPRRSAALGASWRAPGQFTFTPRVRWIGRQFEDDENLLRLGEVVVADLSVARPVGKHLEIFLAAENL
ncbi:MAG: TonB-dependent receptor, partial [Opitutaceae bacterium]|nr:TonB-dependent receptor [Opitutaceae bacterium]